MADNVNISAGTGTVIATDLVTVDGASVHVQRVKLIDGTSNSGTPLGAQHDAATAGGDPGLPFLVERRDTPGTHVSASGDFALPQQNQNGYVRVNQQIDDGRDHVAWYGNAIAAATSEALLTLIRQLGSNTSIPSGATTQTVTVGKKLRLSQVIVTLINGATALTVVPQLKVRLRVNTSGTATTSSPIWAFWHVGGVGQMVNVVQQFVLPIPDGFELPAGASYGLTQEANVATNLTLSVGAIGFEYLTP